MAAIRASRHGSLYRHVYRFSLSTNHRFHHQHLLPRANKHSAARRQWTACSRQNATIPKSRYKTRYTPSNHRVGTEPKCSGRTISHNGGRNGITTPSLPILRRQPLGSRMFEISTAHSPNILFDGIAELTESVLKTTLEPSSGQRTPTHGRKGSTSPLPSSRTPYSDPAPARAEISKTLSEDRGGAYFVDLKHLHRPPASFAKPSFRQEMRCSCTSRKLVITSKRMTGNRNHC